LQSEAEISEQDSTNTSERSTNSELEYEMDTGENSEISPNSSTAIIDQEYLEILTVQSPPPSPTRQLHRLDNTAQTPTIPVTQLLPPSYTIPSTAKQLSTPRLKEVSTSTGYSSTPTPHRRTQSSVLKESITSKTTQSDFPPEISNSAIHDINGHDHPVSKGDILKIVKRFQKSNHTNSEADTDFVAETHPLFTLSTIFPAVVGTVRSRPRASRPEITHRDDITHEASFIYQLIERSAPRAIWESIETYYALYRLHVYIDTQAARLRQEGAIQPGTVGSHTNILVGRAVEEFMCLSKDMSFEALANWKITNLKDWVR
jgi:hypothetical protein